MRKVAGLRPQCRANAVGFSRGRCYVGLAGFDEGCNREEACEILNDEGISANQLADPLAGAVARRCDSRNSERLTAHHHRGENNYSGQFARYLRSETSFVPNGHIRKYDGEPFMPHHIGGGSKRTTRRADETLRSDARDYGLRRETPMATSVQRASQLTMADMKGRSYPDWLSWMRRFRRARCRSKSLGRVTHTEP